MYKRQEDIRTTTVPNEFDEDRVPDEYRRFRQVGREVSWWIFPKNGPWPTAAGGYELEIVESVPQDALPAVTNAVILVARDLYDGGNIMERRTTAQHLLEPFRVIGG